MGLAVVTVAAGGLPVVESTTGGMPVTEASNGYGVPVTKVIGKPGLPVVFETIGVAPGVTYATWEAATVIAVTLSGGNLVATSTGTTSTNQGARVATASGKNSGKYYFEVAVTTAGLGSRRSFGIGDPASTYINASGSVSGCDMLFTSNGNIWANGADSGIFLGVLATATIGGIAADIDNRKIWFRIAPSGNWNNSGTADPVTNVGGLTIPAGAKVPFCCFGGTAGVSGCVHTANFGASAFTGAVPAGFTSGWPA